jgi:alginate O-acetyltransferase complex protein AlgI
LVFSSTFFLFEFLPVCLCVYFAALWLLRKLQFANGALICLSLIFYTIGSGQLVLILGASILFNFFLGRAIAHALPARFNPKALLAIGVTANIGALFYFKYAGFFIYTLDELLSRLGFHPPVSVLAIALPVGISFYTFMAISYLVDVHDTKTDARSLSDFAVYLSLFPHLIAGPIVRFSELRHQIIQRSISTDGFLEGIFRCSIGLTRKVIVADSLATQADRIFALPVTQLTPAIAWLGAICYAFQIFYDFSGYTDMAIGLAAMLGFRFPENFAQPYSAQSVTEFWRRWHMTLTRWFRDYLYIPLGGNRHGTARTYANLFTVFVLCGLWHGAAWTFVAWGVYHGALLVVERLLKNLWGYAPGGVPGVILTFVLVTIGWVFFRSSTIDGSFRYLGAMFGPARAAEVGPGLSEFLTPSTMFYLGISALFAFVPAVPSRVAMIGNRTILKGGFAIAAMVISIAYLSEQTFKPFIYFRF